MVSGHWKKKVKTKREKRKERRMSKIDGSVAHLWGGLCISVFTFIRIDIISICLLIWWVFSWFGKSLKGRDLCATVSKFQSVVWKRQFQSETEWVPSWNRDKIVSFISFSWKNSAYFAGVIESKLERSAASIFLLIAFHGFSETILKGY